MDRTTHLPSRVSRAQRTTPVPTAHVEVDQPSRRIVLRGALVAGCSLLLPGALLGCDTSQEIGSADPDALAPAVGPDSVAPLDPSPGAMAEAPTEATKASQASVQYQAQPKGEQMCGNCMNFVAESSTCKRVDGEISPQGWCVIWANAA